MLKMDIANPNAPLEITVGGKLRKEDYEEFGVLVEELIERYGKLRVLFIMDDFHGWSVGALWEDIKFDTQHFNDIERLALVGDRKWEKGMAVFCKPFTTAQVRYFDRAQLEDARAWLDEQ